MLNKSLRDCVKESSHNQSVPITVNIMVSAPFDTVAAWLSAPIWDRIPFFRGSELNQLKKEPPETGGFES